MNEDEVVANNDRAYGETRREYLEKYNIRDIFKSILALVRPM